jgi:hypothetical protein
MSSISSLMAASSSSRVFAGFFKCPSLSGRRNGTTAFGYPLPPPSTDGGRCPTSQRPCLDNVPTAVTSPEASRGCRRESPSSSVLEAFAFPSTVIGFKLDNLRTSRLPPPEHEAMRFAIALCGPVDPTPPGFKREPFLQDHPRWAARKAPMRPVQLPEGRTRWHRTIPTSCSARGSRWECVRT